MMLFQATQLLFQAIIVLLTIGSTIKIEPSQIATNYSAKINSSIPTLTYVDSVLNQYHVSTFMFCDNANVSALLSVGTFFDGSSGDITVVLDNNTSLFPLSFRDGLQVVDGQHFAKPLRGVLESLPHLVQAPNKKKLVQVLLSCNLSNVAFASLTSNAIREFHASSLKKPTESELYLFYPAVKESSAVSKSVNPFDVLFSNGLAPSSGFLFSPESLGELTPLASHVLSNTPEGSCQGLSLFPAFMAAQGAHAIPLTLESTTDLVSSTSTNCIFSPQHLVSNAPYLIGELRSFKRKWRPSMSILGYTCDLMHANGTLGVLPSLGSQFFNDFEVVLIHDACEDSKLITPMLAKNLAANDIPYRFLEAPGKPYMTAFSQAASLARADYLLFLNLRGSLAPSAIETLYWKSRAAFSPGPTLVDESVGFLYPSHNHENEAMAFNPGLFVTSKTVLQKISSLAVSPSRTLWQQFDDHGYVGKSVAEPLLTRNFSLSGASGGRVPTGPLSLPGEPVHASPAQDVWNLAHSSLGSFNGASSERILYIVDSLVTGTAQCHYDWRILEILRRSESQNNPYITVVVLSEPDGTNWTSSNVVTETLFFHVSEMSNTQAFLDYVFETRGIDAVVSSGSAHGVVAMKRWQVVQPSISTMFVGSLPTLSGAGINTLSDHPVLDSNLNAYVFASKVAEKRFLELRKSNGTRKPVTAIVKPGESMSEILARMILAINDFSSDAWACFIAYLSKNTIFGDAYLLDNYYLALFRLFDTTN